MAKAAAAKEKDPLNFVHQNAILCETITKEQRHQKLYTNYSVNPFKKSKFKNLNDGILSRIPFTCFNIIMSEIWFQIYARNVHISVLENTGFCLIMAGTCITK